MSTSKSVYVVALTIFITTMVIAAWKDVGHVSSMACNEPFSAALPFQVLMLVLLPAILGYLIGRTK